MSDTLLIREDPANLLVQEGSTLLVQDPASQVNLDPSPILVVENRQPTLEVYLHGPPGLQGPAGPAGAAGPGVTTLAELLDVQLAGLQDSDLLQYRDIQSKWLNQHSVDGGNF